MSRKNLKSPLLFLLLVVLGIGGLFAYKFAQFAKMGKQMAAMGNFAQAVSVSEVSATDWQPYLRAVGNFKAVSGVDISSEAPGIVQAIAFKPGSKVEEGETLFQLDDAIEQANLKNDLATLRLKTINYERQSGLYKKSAVSKSEYDQAKAQLDQAEAAVAKTQAQIAQKNIKAPFSGRVGIRQVELGQYITVGGTPLVTLQAMDPLLVDFFIPEQQIHRIQPGMKVDLRIDAFPDEIYQGEVIAIDAKANPNTHNILVQASVPNPEHTLYPGMFTEVNILLPKQANTLVVPQTAIMYSLYGNEVYLVKEKASADGEAAQLVVERQFVTVGEQRGDQVVIKTGLNVGDRIVDAGQHRLHNGRLVVIDEQMRLAQNDQQQPMRH